MESRHSDLGLGMRDVVPILLGIVPFGMISGASAIAAGLDPVTAMSMSLIVFAGASQLAMCDLIARGAVLPVVVLTALVINLRFVMYSAAIAPYLATAPARFKGVASYLLTDQGFVVTATRARTTPDPHHLRWYYLGASLALWTTWQLSNLAGIQLGTLVPPSWGLEFTIPLTFLALLVPVLRDRPSLVAAAVATVVALLGRALPYNLGLIVATVLGVGAGLLVPRRRAP
jgi:predicted branched-subunit amino acid permease